MKKRLFYFLGMITGAAFVLLFLYLPLKEQLDRQERVLNKSLKILDGMSQPTIAQERYKRLEKADADQNTSILADTQS